MSDKNIDNRRITFLLAYGDDGRVDVMFSPEKTYYRIDFPDTLEDGELRDTSKNLCEKNSMNG